MNRSFGTTEQRRIKRKLKTARWKLSRLIGIDKYTYSSLNSLDHKLIELFQGQTGGTFVELGANDGLQQSNTLALETLYGWSGFLIEADPELAAECRSNRKNSVVVSAAAAPDFGLLKLNRDDLVSSFVEGWVEKPESFVWVVAAPLSSILDSVDCPEDFDLLSLDVEGFELEVLKGLDLTRHRPRYILIETTNLDAVNAALGTDYEMTEQWSHHDYLFARKNEML